MVIGRDRRERGGHWLHARSERNIRHSNRPRDIIVVVQELQDSVVPGRLEYTAARHWSVVAGRGAAGQASRRRTMPPTLTSRPLWAVRVRRFSLGRRSGSGRGMLGQTKGEAVRGRRRSGRQDPRLPRLARHGRVRCPQRLLAQRCGRGNIPPGRASRPRGERRLYVMVPGAAGRGLPGRGHEGWSRLNSLGTAMIHAPPHAPNGNNKHITGWLPGR